MNKTINISINSVAFILEENAYHSLSAYLKQVKETYAAEESSNEIIEDIEARIAELIMSSIKDLKCIVTEDIISAIIAQMGTPEVEHNTDKYEIPEYKNSSPIRRRLYRNLSNKLIGGVLSGIASYFNIDRSFIRIIAVIIFITTTYYILDRPQLFAFYGITYLALWLVIPAAKTAREKLEMEGEPITSESISSKIKNNLDSIQPDRKNSKIASIFTNILFTFGTVIKVLFIIIAVAIVSIVTVSLVGTLSLGGFLSTRGYDFVLLFSEHNPILLVISIILVASTPLIFCIYVILKFLLNLKWNKLALISLFAMFIISSAAVTYFAINSRFDHAYDARIENIIEGKIDNNTLEIIPTNDFNNLHTSDMILFDKGALVNRIWYNVQYEDSLPTDLVRVKVEKYSSGSSYEEAQSYVEDIEFNIEISNSKLMFDNKLLIEDKYRGQNITVTVYINPAVIIK